MRHLQIYGTATVKTLRRVSVMSGLQNYFKVKENDRECFVNCSCRFLHFNYLSQLVLWLLLCMTSSNNLRMVLCFRNYSTDRGKTFEIRGWRSRIWGKFEVCRTIYSNSERSKQFFKQNSFLTWSWRRFLRFNILEQFEFKYENNVGIQKPAGKVR